MNDLNFQLDQRLRIAGLPYNKKAHIPNEKRSLIEHKYW